MTWATRELHTPPLFSYKLAAHLARTGNDQVRALVAEAQKLHTTACELDAHVRTLTAENLRLKHENEFMLRLLNERDERSPTHFG